MADKMRITAYLTRYRGRDATTQECPKLCDFGDFFITASPPPYSGEDDTTMASPPVYSGGDAVMQKFVTWFRVTNFDILEAIFYFSSAEYNSSSAFGASPLASASSWTNFEPMMAPLALA